MNPDAAAAEDLGEVGSYYERILPFYELEVLGRRDLAFWRGLCRRFRPRSVLEIGAGLGRVTVELAPLAGRAVGLEPSMAMLARARRRPARGKIDLLAGDARSLPFASCFDLVVAPDDPLCHVTSLDERRTALREIAGCLAPGGRFVLETLRLAPDAPRRRTRRVRDGDAVLVVDETWSPVAPALWRATFRYRLRDRAGDRTAQASFLARPWDAATLEPLFAAAGLAIETIWGDFSGGPFRADSERRIVLARSATTARASAEEASPRRRAAARGIRSRAARRADTDKASRAC
jgi:SAM-dependent methyltransferase